MKWPKKSDWQFAAPNDLLYEQTPVAFELNGILELAELALPENRVDLPDHFSKRQGVNWFVPEDENELALMRRWCHQNLNLIKKISIAVNKPALQFPQTAKNSLSLSTCPYQLFKILTYYTNYLLAEGKYGAAAKLLEDNLKLGEKVQQGEGAVIHFLMGSTILKRALAGIRFYASHPSVPEGVLKRLMDAISWSFNHGALWETCIRVEFADFFWPEIGKSAIRENIRKWRDPHDEYFPLIYDPDTVRAFQVAVAPELLDDHPQPLDLAATLDVAGKYYRQLIHLGQGAFQADAIAKLSDYSLKRQWDHEMQPICALARQKQPFFTPAKLPKTRALFNGIANPLGRMILRGISLGNGFIRPWQNQADREATKAVLACQIYFRRHRQWPNSLARLVKEKLLPRLPLDPFSGQPLHYSPQRQILWSVGQNGRDDQGATDAQNPWQGQDIVWPLTSEAMKSPSA